QNAMTELQGHLEGAEAALRRILDGKPPLELRRRVEQLLEKHEKGILSPTQLRVQRALAVLGQAGSAEALQVLEAPARGASEAWQTQEARAALLRNAKR